MICGLNCFFQYGPELPAPDKLLKGSGTKARHTRLESAADLDRPAVKALMSQALKRASVALDPAVQGRLVNDHVQFQGGLCERTIGPTRAVL